MNEINIDNKSQIFSLKEKKDVFMRRLKIEEHLSNEELTKLIKEEKKNSQLRIWQILFYIKSNFGVQAKSISLLFGVSISSIYHHVQNFNKHGKSGVLIKPKGGRRRFYLTLKKEKEILDQSSKRASEGTILTMNDVRADFEQEIGHKVSDDYIWDIFNRHNWTKKAPRPKNPKQDLEKQDEFKKKSKKSWMPPI